MIKIHGPFRAVAACLMLSAAGYCLVSVFFDAWLEASGTYSTQYAAVWTLGSAVLCVLFLAAAVWLSLPFFRRKKSGAAKTTFD